MQHNNFIFERNQFSSEVDKGNKMAVSNVMSYAEVVDPPVRKTEKPIFIKEYYVFGVDKVPKEQWLTHVEQFLHKSQVKTSLVFRG